MPENGSPSTTDILNGWKEIAAYLGKSVRSVQRWERDLALPVHRIATAEGGQIVYSSRAEIDAWRAGLRDGVGGDSTNAVGRAALPFGHRAIAWAAFVSLTVIAATAVGFSVAPRFVGHPAHFEFEGPQLIAFTDGGWIVWRHTFDRAAQLPATMPRRISTGSVIGYNAEEPIVPVRFTAASNQELESDAVFAFRRDGSVKWKVQPDVRLADDTQTFTGPWQVYDVVVSSAGNPRRVWIAYSHNTWWPAFVVEVTPDGQQRIVYVQAGRIFSIGLFATPGATYLAVGGTVNEYHRASLALLGLDDPPAHSVSATGSRLTCDACAVAGSPRAFYLFPSSEVQQALTRPSGWAKNLVQTGSELRFTTDEGFAEGSVGVIAPTLAVSRYDRSDRYWQAHRTLAEQGRISHSVDDCPERTAPVEIRAWKPGAGWTQYSVATVATRAQVAADR